MLLIICVFSFIDFHGFIYTFISFPLTTVLGVFLLFVLNFIVVTLRYWRVLQHFGYGVNLLDVAKANVSGSVASLLMIPLLGQVAGRHLILERAGVTAVENAAIAFYERFVVCSLSGVFAFFGGVIIFSSEVFYYVKDFPVFEVGSIFILSIISYFYLVAGRRERFAFGKIFSRKSLLNFLEIYALTLLANALVLFSFFMIFSIVLPKVNFLSLLSLAAIVSFLSGLPISFGGWGLRELASVSIVSFLGGATASALAASVLLGGISIVAVLIMFPVLLISRTPKEMELCRELQQRSPVMGMEEIAVWILTLMVGALVFFQIHVQIRGGELNVNLADPFAILILSVAMLNLLFKREIPVWRVPRLNLYLIFMSLTFVAAYLHGYFSFGGSTWASGKLVGWLVLLGYFFCGYMVVRYFRFSGFFKLSKIMLISLVFILFVNFLKWFAFINGFIGTNSASYVLEAYSGNRNALAFQVLMVLVLVLAFDAWYVKMGVKIAAINISYIAITLMVAAVLITASRSAIFTLVVVFISASYLGLARRNFLTASFLTGGVIFLGAQYGVYLFSILLNYDLPDVASQTFVPHFPVSTESSDSLRFSLLSAAFDMWKNYPLFGAGLGAFYHESAEILGVDIVVHNTVLWILAEFGLVGFSFFAIPFFSIMRYMITGGRFKVARNMLFLLLLVFGVMSLFHEVFYQRIFWIIMGACLAAPRLSAKTI